MPNLEIKFQVPLLTKRNQVSLEKWRGSGSRTGEINLGLLVMPENKDYSTTNRSVSKDQRSWFKEAVTDQVWENFSTKENNECNRLQHHTE